MISVVNYGVSNVGSMLNMMKRIGVLAEAISTPSELQRAEKIILPGVGAFDHGMQVLNDLGLAQPLRDRVVNDRVPILGVCLGMQMLGVGSEEGNLPGLGIINGDCKRFRPTGDAVLRVPHMGWNAIAVKNGGRLLDGLPGARFYFVHSYYFVCKDASDELASAQYGVEFTAAVHRDNVWGVQFHPEKSHKFGMALLKNFAEI